MSEVSNVFRLDCDVYFTVNIFAAYTTSVYTGLGLLKLCSLNFPITEIFELTKLHARFFNHMHIWRVITARLHIYVQVKQVKLYSCTFP